MLEEDVAHIVPVDDIEIKHILNENCPCGVQCGISGNSIVFTHFDAAERALAKVG